MPREARIEVRGLRVDARIGVTDAELKVDRPLVLDLALTVPDCAATETDEIDGTVDYAAVAALAVEIVRAEPHRTLERLAAKIADAIAGEFGVAVEVVVAKPGPPMDADVEAVAVRVSARLPGS